MINKSIESGVVDWEPWLLVQLRLLNRQERDREQIKQTFQNGTQGRIT